MLADACRRSVVIAAELVERRPGRRAAAIAVDHLVARRRPGMTRPSAENSFRPLYCGGLWLAEI